MRTAPSTTAKPSAPSRPCPLLPTGLLAGLLALRFQLRDEKRLLAGLRVLVLLLVLLLLQVLLLTQVLLLL